MGKTDIVIIGGGGHATVVLGTILRLGTWNVVGYTDERNTGMDGAEYLGADVVLPSLVRKVGNAAVGIGQIKNCRARSVVYEKLKALGYVLPTIVSKSAVVMQGVTIGEGTFIAEHAYVGPSVALGIMDIVNTGSVVEHDSYVGDFVHLSIRSTLAGGVIIGSGTLIGMGSAVLNGVHVGKSSIVAAGAVVRKQVPDGALVYGNPQKIIRDYHGR
jgi:sugar O-acyltransferase (sialic acid O-acetyltransferase NeuD family)